MAGMEGNTTRPPASANGITSARRRVRIETDEFSPRVSAGDFVEVEELAPADGDEVFAVTVEGGAGYWPHHRPEWRRAGADASVRRPAT